MKIGEEKNLLLGLAQDLHPLDNAHAERTTIKHLRRNAKVLYYYLLLSGKTQKSIKILPEAP